MCDYYNAEIARESDGLGALPAFAAFEDSRWSEVSHMTRPEAKFSQVPAVGHLYGRKALALLVPVQHCPAPADQGRGLSCGLALRSRLANQLKLLRDKGPGH